jgi:hypothetical protein
LAQVGNYLKNLDKAALRKVGIESAMFRIWNFFDHDLPKEGT